MAKQHTTCSGTYLSLRYLVVSTMWVANWAYLVPSDVDRPDRPNRPNRAYCTPPQQHKVSTSPQAFLYRSTLCSVVGHEPCLSRTSVDGKVLDVVGPTSIYCPLFPAGQIPVDGLARALISR
jgi:hypothetical protein